jgi:hypothetical protein
LKYHAILLLNGGKESERRRGNMPLIENERIKLRIKLTATWINTVAAATIVTGVIAPLAAAVFGVPAVGKLSVGRFVIATMAWLVLGNVLTFTRKIPAWEFAGMTPLQLYAFFGVPAILLLWMLGVAWFLHRQDAPKYRDQRQHGPAE